MVARAAASSLIVGAIGFSVLPQISRQTGETHRVVPPTAISWDLQRVFAVPGNRNLGIMGRAFDLLPGGTMLNAHCIHRGVVGVTVKIISATNAEIINSEPVIMARGDTLPDDLVSWKEELLEAFQGQPV